MNANSRCKPLLLSMALGAALLATVPAFAQSTGDDTAVIAEASVPQDRLVDRYSELAGSDAAATDLISDLRTGGDFSVTQDVTTTVTNPDGTTTTTTAPVTTTIANPNGAMGWGEVNITLSLAQALLGSGAAPDLQSALTGASTTVTNPDGTTTTTTAGGVLAMRADGMGWGQIAKELGFNLGTLVSAGNRNAKATDAATAKADRAGKAKAERTTGKPDRVARAERPSRPEKLDRPAKPDRPERPAKPERGGR
ncbi:MAG: hypothetical protein ACYC42_01115 [Lysobacter sp.]